jgi:hypothetical protein
VFPTCRFFGRLAQKGPSKNVSGQAEKGDKFSKNVLFSVFFPYESIENLEFSKISVLVGNVSKI